MLTIRNEQMKALIEVRRQDFEARLTKHLREEFQEELIRTLGSSDETTVRAFVAQTINAAFRYGIEMEDDVTSLAEIQAEQGAGFENRADLEWAARLLNDQKLTSNAKIELLIDGLPGRER